MTFSIQKIDHIQLAAPLGSESQAKEFYEKILGFTEVIKPAELQKNGGVWFENGSINLHIGIEEPFTPARKAHPAFEVNNLEALMRHLEHESIPVEKDHKLPGANRCYVYDPFGNRPEFLEWK